MKNGDSLGAPEQFVIIADRWGAHLGGCESYLGELLVHARVTGIDAGVIAREVPEEIRHPGISCLSVPAYPAFLRARRFEARLSRELGKRGLIPVLSTFPTSVATHYQPHHGAYEMAFAAERESLEGYFRKSLFPIGMRLNIKRQVLMSMEERVVGGRFAKRVMAFSNRVSADLQRCYGIPGETVDVCPLGVDLKRYRPQGPSELPLRDWRRLLPIASDEALLLFVAHNFQLKGLAPLLHAIREAAKLSLKARLLVVGRGDIPAFEGLARRLGIADRVCFVGAMPSEEVADLYRQSDLLVHPTFYDHCSLVTLEALASGCPVITTSRNGASELMVSGREGYILNDPHDVALLADTLAGLQDRQALQRLRHEAAQRRESLDFYVHAFLVYRWLGLQSAMMQGNLNLLPLERGPVTPRE
jgi:UDP-glucose:(heptosyl)LPS alpha-1,3-glucosyltransferase